MLYEACEDICSGTRLRELARSRSGNDADDIAVFFVENGNDARSGNVLERHVAGLDPQVLQHEVIDPTLHGFEFVGMNGFKVIEVKAEAIGRHQRAGLLDRRTHGFAKRELQKMRCGVVSRRPATAIGIHDRGHLVTNRDFALDDLADMQDQPLRWSLRIPDLKLAVRTADHALVADLTA